MRAEAGLNNLLTISWLLVEIVLSVGDKAGW